MRRKTSDPTLIRLLDQEAALLARAETAHRRLKRAFTAVEKIRQSLRRVRKRIQQRHEELQGGPA